MAQRSKKAREKRSAADFFGNRKRGCLCVEKYRTLTGFDSWIFALTVAKASQIQKVFTSAFLLLCQKSLCQNCQHLSLYLLIILLLVGREVFGISQHAMRSLFVLLLTCKGFFCISGWFCFGYRRNSDTSAKRWRAGLKNGALPVADTAMFLWRSGRKKKGRSETLPIFSGTARDVSLVSLQLKKTKRLKFLFLCDIMCSRIKG